MNALFATTILLFALFLPAQSFATEATDPPVASSYETGTAQVGQQPFRIIILGTRNAGDIELIRKNIGKLAYVNLFVPAVVSQRHLEFEGTYGGEADVLIADVESLAQNRYDMQMKNDAKKGLLITLRKIQPAETTLNQE
jgi:hypothetical protein